MVPELLRFWKLFAGTEFSVTKLYKSVILEGTLDNLTQLLSKGILHFSNFPNNSLQAFGGLQVVKEHIKYTATQGTVFKNKDEWVWGSLVSILLFYYFIIILFNYFKKK